MIATDLYAAPRRRRATVAPLLPNLAPAARLIGVLAGVGASAIVVGWLVAHGHAKYVALVGVFGGLLVLAAKAPGPLAALLVLAVLNGVPIVNLNGRLPGALKFSDAAVFALGALLLAYHDRAPSAERARIIRAATIWSAAFIGWWIFTFARSALPDEIPPLKAALFGRDFLYFGILLPLAVSAKFPARSLRDGGLLLLCGAILGGLGQVLQSTTGVSVGLVHPGIFDTSFGGGVNRLYSSMSYVFNTALIFAAALFLSKKSRGYRWLIGPLFVLFLFDAAVQLGRANYFALAFALLVGIGFYTRRYGSLTSVVIRVAFVIPVIITGVLAASSLTGHASVPVVKTVVARAESGVSDIVGSTGTVAYRKQVDGEMLHVLGNKWPVGLGFLHPAAHYVSALPAGSIRNSDTGVFNALMTMGILGVCLMYMPLAYGMRELLRVGRGVPRASQPVPEWVVYGGTAWIAWAVATSPSLVLLFSVPGLVVTALTLAVLAHVISEPERNLHAG